MAEKTKVIFKKNTDVNNVPIKDGQLVFNTETGAHYIDVGNERKPLNSGQYVTPEMFGAKGDGVADDTEAFKKMNGKTAFLGAKTYVISSLTYGRGTMLFGAGMGKTVIKHKTGCESMDMIRMENNDAGGLTNLSLVGRYVKSEDAPKADYPYRALLKIYTTTTHTDYSNNTIYSNVEISHAEGSGLVVLGHKDQIQFDPTISSSYNWVLSPNNFAIHSAAYYGMVDTATDNHYSNFWISGGGLSGLYIYSGSSNLYSNFKVDGPGEYTATDAPDQGARVILRLCGAIQMSNLEAQTGPMDGIKMSGAYGCMIRGRCDDFAGTQLKMVGSCYGNNIDLSFSYGATQPTRNIDISAESYDNFVNPMVWPNKMAKNPDRNQSANTKIRGVIDIPVNVDFTDAKNKEPFGGSSWSISGSAVKTEDLYTGAYTIDGTGTVKQDVRGLIPGHAYIGVVAIKIIRKDTSGGDYPTPYINLSDNGEIPSLYFNRGRVGGEKGDIVTACMVSIAKTEHILLEIPSHNNNGKFAISNMRLVDLSAQVYPAQKKSPFYDELIAKMNGKTASPVLSAQSTYRDEKELTSIIGYLMNRQ